MRFEIVQTYPGSEYAKDLIDKLTESLAIITGETGKTSFSNQNKEAHRSSFLVLRADDENVACGALRPISVEVCEIKRMFSTIAGQGYGKKILTELELSALNFEYKEIWISTRKINKNAVNFYLNNGYQIQPNYGSYKDKPKSICFIKKINV